MKHTCKSTFTSAARANAMSRVFLEFPGREFDQKQNIIYLMQGENKSKNEEI